MLHAHLDTPLATEIANNDLTDELTTHFRRARLLAVDVETSGLDPTSDTLALVTIASNERVALVRAPGLKSRNLRGLFTAKPQFLFHFARFDLSFLIRHLGLRKAPEAIICTKVAARLARGPKTPGTLQELVKSAFGYQMSKTTSLRRSDWLAPTLSADQIDYAVDDVRWLSPLWHVLRGELTARRRLEFAKRCFQTIATIATVDAMGQPRLFEYR